MDKLKKIINANENRMARSVYNVRLNNGQTVEHLVVHIPTAKKLISQYAAFEYKNIPEHPLYVMAEYHVCHILEDSKKSSSRDLLVGRLAVVLECNPLMLYNATDLPF